MIFKQESTFFDFGNVTTIGNIRFQPLSFVDYRIFIMLATRLATRQNIRRNVHVRVPDTNTHSCGVIWTHAFLWLVPEDKRFASPYIVSSPCLFLNDCVKKNRYLFVFLPCLLDELFGIKNSTATFPEYKFISPEDPTPEATAREKRRIILNSSEELFAELRDCNFTAVSNRFRYRIGSGYKQNHLRKSPKHPSKLFAALWEHILTAVNSGE